MAQIIKHRRGSLATLKNTTARNGELIIATGSVGNLQGPFIFIGSPVLSDEGVAGAFNAVSKIYQGANAPSISAGTYGSGLDGTPFYASSENKLYILNNDNVGNTTLNLVGNIEGNTISGVTITNLTGTTATVQNQLNVSGSLNVTGSLYINGTSYTAATSGTSGSNGTDGTSGSSGSNGTDGTSGSNGTDGTSGSNGTDGSSGSNGTDGSSGTSGSNGTDGSSGSNGTDGSSGSSGSNGTDGSSGSSGSNGTDGTSGSNGTDGSSGTSGSNGTDGSSGSNGTDGSSGTSGSNGTDGSSGSNGTDGTSGTGFDTIFNAAAGRVVLSDGTTNAATASANISFNDNILDISGSFVRVTGSMYVSGDLVVQGSSSLVNITGSALDIGTNTIILNTATPGVRFGGISVQDSGSNVGVSGSLFWDSINNVWVYQQPSDSLEGYGSARLIAGPQNTGSLGQEIGLTTNYIQKAVGEDHIGDSNISDDGTVVTVHVDTDISGSIRVTGDVIINGTSYNAATSGTSGSNGTDGTSGTSGSNGTDGSSGSSGSNGTDGSSGSNGTDGSSGSNGTDGSSGTSGSNGTDGTSGSNGTDGTSGSNGTDGTSGSNGTDGTSGSNGTDGSSGTSGDSLFAQTGSFWATTNDVQFTGSISMFDVSSSFTIDGNSFGQTYLNGGGALVLNPGFGGVEIVGTYSDLKVGGNLTTNGWVSSSTNFRGDGSGLFNIPASGVTGLELNKIVSGSVSASISDGALRVNGDTYIDGVLTAKEFNVTLVSSSVLYQSGSTKFGDSFDDTHSFTGSVDITGSITLNGVAVGTGKLDESWFNSYVSGSESQFAGTSSYAIYAENAVIVSGQTKTLTVGSASTTWSFNHNLGYKYPAINVFDNSDKVVIPTEIEVIDSNNLKVYFNEAQTGTVIATVGGNGSSGTSGSNGTDGSSGSNGTDGSSGTSGSNGTDGSSGSNGTDGSSGTSGSNGTDGTSGTSGSNGTDGSSGSNGTDGTSGSSGSNGTDGSSGSNGTDGSSGTSGSNGTDGSSGTSGDSLFALTGSIWNTTNNIGITGSLYVSESLNVSGSMTLGSSASSYLMFKGVVSSSFIPDSDASDTSGIGHIIGLHDQRWKGVYASTGSFSRLTNDYTPSSSVVIERASVSGSFTGSYIGDGAGLYNIPASGVTGLELNKIVNGSVSASVLSDGTFRVNGDTYIDGILTAKELHIDYVTSSVLYTSGSTKFGDTLDDIHQFTGSVYITGSRLEISGGDLIINGTSYTAATSGTSGSNGTDGSSGTSGSNGTDGTSGSSGSNGTDGSSGSNGTDGSSGTSGSNGTDGTSGSNGTDGSSGTSGSNGTDGSSGTSGVDGLSGTSGSSGSSGSNGTDGSSGSNGTDGSSGTSGSNGTDGSSGSSGSNGTDGSSGSNGTDGSSGTSGSNGTDGSSGTSGSNGTDGTSGSNGTDGSSGSSGSNGTDGSSGSNGTDGSSGTSGSNGTDGTSGTSVTVSGTNNTIGKFQTGVGDPTLIDSSMTDDGSKVTINSDLIVTGTTNVQGNTSITGSLTVASGSATMLGGDLYVSGNLQILGSSTNVNIQSQTVEIGDNIILVNAYSPFQRYAGITGHDSGSVGGSGSMLWDSTNDNWLAVDSSNNSAKVIGTTAATLGSETSLTSGTFPIGTSDNTIGDSLLTYSGTTLQFNTDKFTVESLSGNTVVAGTLQVSTNGSDLISSTRSNVTFKNANDVFGEVSTTDTTDVVSTVLGYRASDGQLVFSNIIDGGTF